MQRNSIFSKKKRLKEQTVKQIATNYLLNISLNGTFDDIRQNEIENNDDYNIILKLNKVTADSKNELTDYLKFYKEKQQIENPECNRLEQFIAAEFKNDLESISASIKNVVLNIEESEMVDVLGKSTETFIKQKLQRNTSDRQSSRPMFNNSIKSTKSNGLDSILKNSSKSSDLENLNDHLNNSQSVNSRLAVPPMQRTISESSTESIYNMFYSTTQRSSAIKPPKKSIQNILKRIHNEKIVFISSNSVIGLFSRIPYSRQAVLKPDLNDSLQLTKNRHLSVNKYNAPVEQFIGDVFDYFDLDYYEYLNSDLMSFEYLIEPKPVLKPRLNEDQTVKEQIEQESNENNEDLSDKDDFDIKFVQNLHKRGRLRKRTVSVDTDATLINDRKHKFKENGLCSALTYEASYLDDPKLTELTAGKNRTCLKFASYSVSIIDYVKPLELKKEINETFKEKFPLLQISLTKLRSIKNELYEIINECSMDVIIVAQSFVYFERLILQGLINKSNRKHLAGASLLLSAKLNDVTKKEINRLIDVIVQKFRLDNRKDLISFEFPILVALEFDLTVNYEKQMQHHYERITNSSYIKYQKAKVYVNNNNTKMNGQNTIIRINT